MTDVLMFAGVEAGGTKFNCIVARQPDQIAAQVQLPTTTPTETIGRVIEFFRPFSEKRTLAALGVGSFGPCDLVDGSPTYGYITSTPKPGWQNADILGPIQSALSIPAAFDTDVNAAALGESRWGAARGTVTSLYLTVGTGIGGGLIVDGKPLHGLRHPEMGHIRIPHERSSDPFPGSCPFHGDCFEGLVSGPAIQARFGVRGEQLADDDPFWELESDYIAAAVATYILVTSPQRIVLGGGIMQRTQLLPQIRKKVVLSIGGYIRDPAVTDEIDAYIVAPGLGKLSGVLGAVALAASAVSPT